MSRLLGELEGLRAESEAGFRARVLRLLGAVPVEGWDSAVGRRVAGTVLLDGGVLGLVVFAEGDGGRGVAADVVSKHARPSALSLLRGWPGAGFVLLVTAGVPPAGVVELAQRRSGVVVVGGARRSGVWVMGVPELARRCAAAAGGGGRWWLPSWLPSWLPGGGVPGGRVSPLLVR